MTIYDIYDQVELSLLETNKGWRIRLSIEINNTTYEVFYPIEHIKSYQELDAEDKSRFHEFVTHFKVPDLIQKISPNKKGISNV